MSKKTDELLQNWQNLQMSERLSLLEELLDSGELDDEIITALQELFLQEVAQISQTLDADDLTHQVLTHLQSIGSQHIAPPKKKTRRKKTVSAPETDADGTMEDVQTTNETSDQPSSDKPKKRRDKKAKKPEFAQETMLEFVEDENGTLVLREVNETESLVRIDFSDKVKNLLGDDYRLVGQAMIHAAIAKVVQSQSGFYHAHIYDEEPQHYS